MEKEIDKNKYIRQNVLIIILLVVIIGLGGCVAYDNYLDKKENEKRPNQVETTTTEVSENDALSIGNELWKYAYSTFWGNEPAWKSHLGEKNEYGGQEKVCDTTTDEIKQKYTSDFKAQSCYGDGVTCADYTIDNFIPQTTCLGAARGGLQDYKDTTLTVKSIEENTITFTATSTYTNKTIEKDFIIKKQNDTWQIAQFYLPN